MHVYLDNKSLNTIWYWYVKFRNLIMTDIWYLLWYHFTIFLDIDAIFSWNKSKRFALHAPGWRLHFPFAYWKLVNIFIPCAWWRSSQLFLSGFMQIAIIYVEDLYNIVSSTLQVFNLRSYCYVCSLNLMKLYDLHLSF